MDTTDSGPAQAPLNGWKEIAGYLGRSIRAVQRYERELGLPIHRIRTADGQSVYAFRDEIDGWRASVDQTGRTAPAKTPEQPDQASVRPPRRWASPGLVAVGVLVVLAATTSLFLARQGRVGDPRAFRWRGNIVDAVDARDQILWSYDFGEPVRPPEFSNSQLIDLDGDGVDEVLLPVTFTPSGAEIHGPAPSPRLSSDALYAFSRDGRLRWKVAPDLSITCGDSTFTGPWSLKAVTASQGEARRTWVAFSHHTWRPGFILEITPSGEATVRYVQPGWIYSVTEWSTAAGTVLAAGGVFNEFERASVVLVDPNAAPAKAPSENAVFNCGSGSESSVRRVYLLPLLGTTVTPQIYDFVTGARVIGTDLKVSQEGAQAILQLRPDFQIAEYATTDSYVARHRELERDGRIDHPVAKCPTLLEPQEVREWSPTSGWQTLMIQPPNPPRIGSGGGK